MLCARTALCDRPIAPDGNCFFLALVDELFQHKVSTSPAVSDGSDAGGSTIKSSTVVVIVDGGAPYDFSTQARGCYVAFNAPERFGVARVSTMICSLATVVRNVFFFFFFFLAFSSSFFYCSYSLFIFVFVRFFFHCTNRRVW